MLEEQWRLIERQGSRAGGWGVSHERNRAAAEIHRAARVVKNHLYAGRIGQLFFPRQRRSQRGHSGRWILFQQFDHAVNVFRKHLRFVSLHIDKDIRTRVFAGDFCYPVGAAGALCACHQKFTMETFHFPRDFRMIRGDDYACRPLGCAGRFVGVLQQRLACFAEQHFPRQARGGVTGRNYDVTAKRSRWFGKCLRHLENLLNTGTVSRQFAGRGD